MLSITINYAIAACLRRSTLQASLKVRGSTYTDRQSRKTPPCNVLVVTCGEQAISGANSFAFGSFVLLFLSLKHYYTDLKTLIHVTSQLNHARLLQPLHLSDLMRASDGSLHRFVRHTRCTFLIPLLLRIHQ